MEINHDSLAYINKMWDLATQARLPENRECPECEQHLFDRKGDNTQEWLDAHVIIDLPGENAQHILIIGCEGFYIFLRDGRLRSHDGSDMEDYIDN